MSIKSELLAIARQCQAQAERLEQQLGTTTDPTARTAVERGILNARREARQALTAATKAPQQQGDCLASEDSKPLPRKLAELPDEAQQAQESAPRDLVPQQQQIAGLGIAIAPPVICPECGHDDHQKRGVKSRGGHRRQHYQCKHCHKWFNRVIALEPRQLDACTVRS